MKLGSDAGKVIKLCACTLFVIIGLLMCLANGREAYEFARNGGTVDAKVIKVEPSPKGKGMRPLLRYKVNETTYMRFGDDVSDAKKYNEGQMVPIRYSKEDPNTITMLDPNRNVLVAALWGGLAVVAFVAGAIVALAKPNSITTSAEKETAKTT